MKRYSIITFGCQMNEHDSEKMAGVLAGAGLGKAASLEASDLVIVNTCSIREKAEQKFQSELGKLRLMKRDNPAMRIVVAGCIAQQEGGRILRRAPFVDAVLGNQNIRELARLAEDGGGAVLTEFPDGYEHADGAALRDDPVSGYVNIMYGCDNFCSYCVVPHVRGHERSRRPEAVLDEVRALASSGHGEVTLLGQNVNSYGRGPDGGVDFPALLGMVDSVEGIERIRFVTSHPKDLSEALVDAVAHLPKVCEAIHLPMQSGSDRVLAAMNRRYGFAGYMDKVRMLRDAVPGMAITTDIIVGFPGETEEEFEATVAALDAIRFDGIFPFRYSKRPNTAALKLPGHLPEEVKLARLERVIELQGAISEEKNKSLVGSVAEVMVKGPDRSGIPGRMTGRARDGRAVNFDGGDTMPSPGSLVKVRITEGRKHSLVGELVHEAGVPA